jgi:tRNA(Ile2) C34 agmatinyltransferase TiaS
MPLELFKNKVCPICNEKIRSNDGKCVRCSYNANKKDKGMVFK